MLGSLMILLRQIFAIHTVIVRAIASANGNIDTADSCGFFGQHQHDSTTHLLDETLDHINGTITYNEDPCNRTMLEDPVGNTTGNGQQIEIPEEQLKSLKVGN